LHPVADKTDPVFVDQNYYSIF